VIGNGVVLDPIAFLKEIGGLREIGVKVDAICLFPIARTSSCHITG